MLKTALKIEENIEVEPKKIDESYGKRESKAHSKRKFQGFCDIFNGI